MDLAGKNVVITGAAGGIGKALAQRFHAAGANVVTADLDAAGAVRNATAAGSDAGRLIQVTDPLVLERLGLRAGEPVRFRRNGTGRWTLGRVSGVAADGSITLYDANGAARNLRPTVVEVRRPGQKGRLRWQVLSDVAITWEQLLLW